MQDGARGIDSHDGTPNLRRAYWPVNEASISCRMVRYALKRYSSEALWRGRTASAINHPTAEAVRILSARDGGNHDRWIEEFPKGENLP